MTLENNEPTLDTPSLPQGVQQPTSTQPFIQTSSARVRLCNQNMYRLEMLDSAFHVFKIQDVQHITFMWYAQSKLHPGMGSILDKKSPWKSWWPLSNICTALGVTFRSSPYYGFFHTKLLQHCAANTFIKIHTTKINKNIRIRRAFSG